MISVIVCSIDPAKFAAVKAMYGRVMGNTPWELIGIHDAKSMCEGYMRGVALSRGQTLIFCHDDVEVISDGFAGKVLSHLEQFDLIGVAGTTRLCGDVWLASLPPHVFGQVATDDAAGVLWVNIFGVPRRTTGHIQGLDGMFLATRRSTFEKVRFDPVTFDGFHCYDLDFSFAAFNAGLRCGVVNDINLLHSHVSIYDEVWAKYNQRFAQKWSSRLWPSPMKSFTWTLIPVASRAEAVEIMNPAYWDDKP